tara:strand:+ start:38 stop:376 length:339 start_codon:yes stop_codon:yes gene_type:complete
VRRSPVKDEAGRGVRQLVRQIFGRGALDDIIIHQDLPRHEHSIHRHRIRWREKSKRREMRRTNAFWLLHLRMSAQFLAFLDIKSAYASLTVASRLQATEAAIAAITVDEKKS